MRLLFVTSALASHHLTMIPFCWAAIAAGHEVRVATTPDLAADAAMSGLPVIAVGPDIRFVDLHREQLAKAKAGETRYDPKVVFCAVAEAMADELVELARSWRPDAVLWDPSTLAGPLAATLSGAMSIRYLWGVDILGRGRTLTERLPDQFHDLYRRFGLEVPDDPGWWSFDPCPPSIAPVANHRRLFVRYVPYSANGDASGWAPERGDRPRVCLTFGASTAFQDFIAGGEFANSALLTGLRELDVELLLAVSAKHRDQLGPMPDFVRVVSSCPLPLLLSTCDAVVHHGGYGSLLTAALCGVPQLAVPYMPDLRFGAVRFTQTGAVRILEPQELSGQLARSHVVDLLNDEEYRSAAGRLRQEMLAQPTPAELVGELAALVGGALR